MRTDDNFIKQLSDQYGDAFYLLDAVQFSKNFDELLCSMQNVYPNSQIAYSYKTNYVPQLCKIVNNKGGYAEIVSSMELSIARKCGVEFNRIIFNGPYKTYDVLEQFLTAGGIIHIDNINERNLILEIASRHIDVPMNVSIRCNFPINDGVTSRFGLDISNSDFEETISAIKNSSNIILRGIHCHFACRSLETWTDRVKGMIDIIEKYGLFDLDYVDLGGGIFGKMAESLKKQFNSYIPSYEEYCFAFGKIFNEYYTGKAKKPLLLVEPGSALVGDCMRFVSKVVSIKTIKGKAIATLAGSIYNINPTLNKKNPPIIIHSFNQSMQTYNNLDFGGFTCIESDYLYRGFDGPLSVGDYVDFSNVGSYSIVLKPPFILPNFPVIMVIDDEIILVKRQETFEDIFQTFDFEAQYDL